MANTLTRQIINDGERNAVIHVYIASDGLSGELTNSLLVDASELGGTFEKLSICRISGGLTGFSAILEWEAAADVPFLALTADEAFGFDYGCFGGLQSNAGAGANGDILITTSGFTATGDVGHITLELKKQ